MTQPRVISNVEWVILLRDNADKLRALARGVIGPAAHVLMMQAQICDVSADRMDCLLREQELSA